MFLLSKIILSKTAIFNVGSLILGIVAWLFGSMAIASKKKKRVHSYSVGSFSVCAISLVSQILEIENRFMQRDYAAIDDTIGGVIFASIVLVVVTIVLNIVAIVKHK